jgi:hypothetical protein
VLINLPEQSKHDFKKARITNYIEMMELLQWRTLKPEIIFGLIDEEMGRRLD